MDKYAKILKQAESSFSEHVVEVTDLGPNMKSLLWRRPGTLRGAIEYLFRGNLLVVSGDYGAAVYSCARTMSLDWLAGLDVSYFSTLVDASPSGRDFSEWDRAAAIDRINKFCDRSIDALYMDAVSTNEIWQIFEQDGKFGAKLREPESGDYYETGLYDNKASAFDIAMATEQVELDYRHEEVLQLYRGEYAEMVAHADSKAEWTWYLDNVSSEVKSVLLSQIPFDYVDIGSTISSDCMMHLIGLKMAHSKCADFDSLGAPDEEWRGII